MSTSNTIISGSTEDNQSLTPLTHIRLQYEKFFVNTILSQTVLTEICIPGLITSLLLICNIASASNFIDLRSLWIGDLMRKYFLLTIMPFPFFSWCFFSDSVFYLPHSLSFIFSLSLPSLRWFELNDADTHSWLQGTIWHGFTGWILMRRKGTYFYSLFFFMRM